MAGGYKFGGNVNIGHNPSFAPELTGSHVGNPHSNIVMGYNNNVEGNYNAAFGTLNTISGTSDAQANFVAGYQNTLKGGVSSVMLGYGGTTHQSGQFSVALGYAPEITANGYAGIAMGASKADGTLAIAMGYGSTGSASYTIAMGMSAKATATTAIALQGNANADSSIAIGGTSSGDSSIAIGNGASAQTSGSIALGKGSMQAGRLGGFRLNANGGRSISDSYQICQALGTTTDDTPTKIYLASGGSTDGNLVIGTSTTVQFTCWVQASKNDSDTIGACYKLEGAVTRSNSDVANPAFLGSVSKTVIHESDANMDVNITVNNTNKCLDIEVTGIAATQLGWLATWHLHQNQ